MTEKEKRSVRWKNWYAKNRAKRLDYLKAYHPIHRPKVAENTRIRARAWYHRTKKKRAPLLRAASSRFYFKHREKCVLRNKLWVKKNYAYTLEYRRRLTLQKNFGITIEQYDEMLKSQNGKCAVCFKICTTGRRLAVDHCHKTKKVRGLLCSKCNRGLGLFNDSQHLLKAAIEYLEKQFPPHTVGKEKPVYGGLSA